MPRLARLLRTVVKLAEIVLNEPQSEPVQLGNGGYADRGYIGLLALREATTDTCAETIDHVRTTPRLQAALDLEGVLAGPPAPSTLCLVANRPTATFWTVTKDAPRELAK